MAYCKAESRLRSKGDVAEVTFVGVEVLAFGSSQAGAMNKQFFARVLTPDELRILPNGTEIVSVRAYDGFLAGKIMRTATNIHPSVQSTLYALISLPDNEQDERIKRMENELATVEASAKKLRDEIEGMKA